MCFSMYSDMSRLMSACFVAEQELGERLGELGLADTRWAQEDERARGRFGSLSPARVRRMAWLTALMESCWPMTRLWSSSSMRSSLAVSSSVSL